MLCATPPAAATGIIGQTVFGRAAAHISTTARQSSLHVALPVLAGSPEERLVSDAEPPFSREGFLVLKRNEILAGFALMQPDLDLETGAADLYQRLFSVCRGLHLYRIWNYVPRINAIEHGLENYRRFCRGRSLAFERQFGEGFRQILPAASAVGTTAGPLALSFLAGTIEPGHFENPRQVPAFAYPPQYGPRPPSFARATVVQQAGVRQIIISGTAAIIGHESVAPGDLGRQVECTLENLRVIGAEARAGDNLGAGRGWKRRFKIYLRHAANLAAVTQHLHRDLLQAGDTAQYLQADLCRADLLIEIEAVLTAPAA